MREVRCAGEYGSCIASHWVLQSCRVLAGDRWPEDTRLMPNSISQASCELEGDVENEEKGWKVADGKVICDFGGKAKPARNTKTDFHARSLRLPYLKAHLTSHQSRPAIRTSLSTGRHA